MASGHTTLTDQFLIRDQLYSKQLKSLLEDDLQAMKWVRILSDFPDGNTFNIPSLGEADAHPFNEGQAIKYDRLDTGNFQFEIDTYEYSAHSISEKFKRDSFWAANVESAFAPRQHRAIMERIETRILSRGPSGQTPSNLNVINTADHRWVGGGTGERITLEDFARARYALKKANVPLTNLTAVVDPSVTFTLETQANLTNLLTPQPRWSDTIHNGLSTGYQFRFNIAGFDVYESNYLPEGLAETIDGRTTTDGVANQFFSAAPGDTLPLVGAFRQMPTVYSEFNKDLQQEEFMTITEYGFKLFRPENMVVVITDKDVV